MELTKSHSQNSIVHCRTFELPKSSSKIKILVDALRTASEDSEIKKRELIIPDDCGKYGFSEGYFNLSTMLHFLADMLEE